MLQRFRTVKHRWLSSPVNDQDCSNRGLMDGVFQRRRSKKRQYASRMKMADDDDDDRSVADEFRLPTTERLRQSKKKRAQQLKKYAQHEKLTEKESSGKRSKKAAAEKPQVERKTDRKVQFPGSITLMEAAARNDKDEVRRLLRTGISPDVCNPDGLTALHQCCIDDSMEMLTVLLEFGANVNATDCELWTPLHAAATCGRIHICKLLVQRGADLLATNGDGNMPYDICEHEATLDYIENEMARQGITQELIDETRLVRENNMLKDLKGLHDMGGDLEFRGRNGETPLHIAATNGYLDVAEFLLSHHVRVNSVDSDQWQPIHCAACWGQLSVLELLLEHGASLDSKTNSGLTALEICEDPEMRQKIIEIREAIEDKRIVKSREISRRTSSTIRSASVRRSSMREKNAMSWKEAKEEAKRMMESAEAMDCTGEDDDDNGGVDENGLKPSGKESSTTNTKPLNSTGGNCRLNFPENSQKNSLDGVLVPRSVAPPGDREAASGDSLTPVLDTAAVKINGLTSTSGSDPPSAPLGTLSDLKKQRSSNRASEVHPATERGDGNKLPSASDHEQNICPPTDVAYPTHLSSNDAKLHQTPSPHTVSRRKTVSSKGCCAIV